MNQNNIFVELESYLKKHCGMPLPQIRYFDGTNKFSTVYGDYTSDTLEGSVRLFLESVDKTIIKVKFGEE